MPDPAPIGVFDSGLGGLTVVRALKKQLPQESILYLGDTARVPYGTKSAAVVGHYASNCARFLVNQGAKAIVAACNTASAVAWPQLAGGLDKPVVGVINPGARLAAQRSKGRIGVIGTEGTIRSNRYQELIQETSPTARVFATPCPLFVPLAEEGMADHPATEIIAREYLAPLLAEEIDTLVLGCTHYPALRPLLSRICGPDVEIIDSATAVAFAVEEMLDQHGLAAAEAPAVYRFFGTDVGERFARVGEIFLGESVAPVEWVDVTRSPDGHVTNAPLLPR